MSVPATMRAARLHAPRDLRIDSVPLAAPGDDEVVVRMRRSAIAGTDLKFFDGTLVPEAYPQGVGGAGVGEVVARGSGVDRLAVGQRVLALGPAGCGQCVRCRQGRGGLCLARTQPMRRRGACFAEYVVLPAFQCEPVDDGLSDEQVIALPTLSLATHVQAVTRYGAGDAVVVIGAGKVGSGQVRYAAHRGARVCAVEPRADRRASAMQLGADLAIDPAEAGSPARITDWAGGIVEFLTDAACTVEAQRYAFDLATPGATIALLGTAPWEVPVQWLVHRSLTVVGCRAGSALGAAARLVLDESVDLTDTITHRFPLEALPEAYAWLADEPAGALMVVVEQQP